MNVRQRTTLWAKPSFAYSRPSTPGNGTSPLPVSYTTARWRACLYASAQQCALVYIAVLQRTSAQSPTANATHSAIIWWLSRSLDDAV